MNAQHPTGLKLKCEDLDFDVKVEDEPLDHDESKNQGVNRCLSPFEKDVQQQSGYRIHASDAGVPRTTFGECGGSYSSTQTSLLGPHHAAVGGLSADSGASSSQDASCSRSQTVQETRDVAQGSMLPLSGFFQQLMDASGEDEVSEYVSKLRSAKYRQVV
jgi:hypothetical protein